MLINGVKVNDEGQGERQANLQPVSGHPSQGQGQGDLQGRSEAQAGAGLIRKAPASPLRTR